MASSPDLLSSTLRWFLTGMSRRRFPQIEGKINLKGLNSPVEIIRDRWGIPHIYASNLNDLFFAQGYAHAQDRLWQMELNRRTAQGRLSEIFGGIALDTDRTVRTFGFNRLGKIDWDAMEGNIKDTLLAYAEGVNAFINAKDRKLPVEFSLIRHQPEPWQPVDSAAFMRVMIWQLSHAWYGEVVRAQVIQAVGEKAAAELEIDYPDENPLTLPEGIELNQLDFSGTRPSAHSPFLAQGLGSNAWTIAGHKSDTGMPYLCNDVHLPLSLPSLWYHVHLISGDFHVTGVSLPGIPCILVGHNAHIAWGMTLAYTDCEDLFVEKFDPNAPTHYQTETGWQEAQVIPELIIVKGKPEAHLENVVITRHGPLISDVIGYAQERLAVQSMALKPSQAFYGWYCLNLARNWSDFRTAMKLIEAPQLNVSYADTDGNIGHWVTGKVPLRAKGDGRLPAPGWTSEYEWSGEIPFDEMPHALNPQKGFITTCNNRLVDDDYPYYLGSVWMNGYRARRICEELSRKELISHEDMRALHRDYTSLPGKEFVTRLETFESNDPDAQLALLQLRDWDCVLSPDSIGGAIYEVVRYRLVRNLLDPALGEELTFHLMGQGFHPLLLASNEFFGHDTVTMLRFLDHPESRWVIQAGGRDEVIERSLKEGVNWLRSRFGPDINRWRWGNFHRIIFSHALSVQKPLDKVFDRGPYPIGGDTDTPCQTAMHPQEPYDNKAWSPGYRQIVDLGDLSRSIAILPPGQSGQLGNSHYDDLISPWLKGEYYPMLWTREQVEREIVNRLILQPIP